MSYVARRPATAGFKRCEAFASVSILILHSSLCTPLHPSLTHPFKPQRIRERQHRARATTKGRWILGKDVAPFGFSVPCMADVLPFVSFCFSLALSLLHSLLYLLLLIAERRQGQKERVTVKKRGMRRMRTEGRERGEGKGRRAPVSRQGFNEEPLKFAVIEQHPCPLQKGPTSLPRHAVVSSPFPFFHLSLLICLPLSLSIPCEIFTSSFSSWLLFTNPPLPLRLPSPALHLLSVIRTWIMSLLN